MSDLCDLYEQLLPSMSYADYDNLPSERQILEAVHGNDVDNVATISIIATGREYRSNYYVIVKLAGTFIKISCSYSSEYGFAYDYNVQIVEQHEIITKVWCVV